MTRSTSLPPAFADLQPFVGQWCLPDERSRHRTMLAAGIDGLRPFYDAMLPRAAAVIEHLNGFPLDDLPPAEQALFDLTMTFFETAHPIELRWPTPDIGDPPTCHFEFNAP